MAGEHWNRACPKTNKRRLAAVSVGDFGSLFTPAALIQRYASNIAWLRWAKESNISTIFDSHRSYMIRPASEEYHVEYFLCFERLPPASFPWPPEVTGSWRFHANSGRDRTVKCLDRVLSRQQRCGAPYEMLIKARPDLVALDPFDVVGQMRYAESKDCVMMRIRAAKGDFPDLTRGHKSYGYCLDGCDEQALKHSPPGTFLLDDMIFVAPGALIKGVRDAWVSERGPRAVPRGLNLPRKFQESSMSLGCVTHGVRLCTLHFSGAPIDSRLADHLPDVLKCKGEFSQRVTCGEPFAAGNQGGGVPPPCPYPFFFSSSCSPPPVCSAPEPPPQGLRCHTIGMT